MALSGSIQGTYKGWTVRSDWSASQSVAGNYSDITVNHYLVMASGYKLSIGSRTNSCTVNGQQQNFTSPAINVSINPSGTTIHLGTTSYRVGHNVDGTKSCSIATTFNIQATLSGKYVAAISASGTITLNTILRQANITSAPDFNDTQSPKVNYSNPAGSAVSSLQIAIVKPTAVGTVYCAYRDISKSGGSYTFNFTQAELQTFYNATANSKTLPVRFRIKTVISGTTLYSDVDRTLTIVDCYPVFNASYQDTNSTTVAATGNNQLIVQSLSTLRISVANAATFKGATVKTAKCTIMNTDYTANISNGSATLNIGTVNSSSNLTVPVTVTDSRGYYATLNLTIRILAWSAPTADINLAREAGFYTNTYITVDANWADDIQNNQLSIKARYKKTTASSYGSYVTLQDNVQSTFQLDNNFAWNVQIVVADNFGSTTYNSTVGRGVPMMFRDILRQSVGFGMFPKYNNSVEIDGRLFVNNEDIVSKFTGIGGVARSAQTSNWNTACSTLSGIYMGSNMSNAPGNSSNWFFVLHMAHNNLYQRQLAFDFFGLGIYTRRMDNGNWGNWVQLDASGGVYMEKSVYDTNSSGIVDNAEKVNNKTVEANVPANAKFTDTTYTAGAGITINNGVISCNFADGDSEAY